MLTSVGPTVLEMMVALQRDVMGMMHHLMMMTMVHALRPKVKVMVLRVMLPEIASTRPQLTSPVMCEGGHHVWTVM
jgi:hypothetical protein